MREIEHKINYHVENMQHSRKFQTKDLGLASVLETLGYKTISLEKYRDGRSKVFVFNDPHNRLEEVKMKYMKRELKVEPWTLLSNIKRLRGLVIT